MQVRKMRSVRAWYSQVYNGSRSTVWYPLQSADGLTKVKATFPSYLKLHANKVSWSRWYRRRFLVVLRQRTLVCDCTVLTSGGAAVIGGRTGLSSESGYDCRTRVRLCANVRPGNSRRLGSEMTTPSSGENNVPLRKTYILFVTMKTVSMCP